MGSVAAAQGLSCPEVWRIFPDQELNLCPLTGSGNKESACNEGNLGSISGWERSPGEGQKQNFSWAVHKAFFSSAHRSLSETHTGNNALKNTITDSKSNGQELLRV